ncbi:hypothetical protein DSL92_09040 [Billgrantia gudaonensis]|uniref:Bacterial Ig-like domain-containing protein n=1 Tax=Billgrantia gudaonensis TaxID=376427 RepID=A0A432JHP6_9GAMM|nr:hypothetical protein DSL92_09040 [Halomonas gudaonensis]
MTWPGDYTATATATDDAGNSDSATADSGFTLPEVTIDTFTVTSADNEISTELEARRRMPPASTSRSPGRMALSRPSTTLRSPTATGASTWAMTWPWRLHRHGDCHR